MHAFFILVYWLLAWVLAWKAVNVRLRIRQRSLMIRTVLGACSGFIFSSFIAGLMAPSAPWVSYLFATFLLFVMLGWYGAGCEKETKVNASQETQPSPDLLSAAQVQQTSLPSSLPAPFPNNEHALAELRQLCQMITADGSLDEEEIIELKVWLETNTRVLRDGLVRRLAKQIEVAFADGEVDTIEMFDLLDLAEAVGQGKTLADLKDWAPTVAVPISSSPENRPTRSRRSRQQLPRLEGRKLDTIRFSYRNSDGEYSERSVVVHVLDAEYFEGYCLKRKMIRTFRLDRIIGEVVSEQTGELASAEMWAASLRVDSEFDDGSSPIEKVIDKKEVLFTGFAKAERERLEQQAEEAGWLVRKSVTQNLDYLCIGPRAGASKVESARLQGASILSREEFEELLAVPEL